MPTPAGFPNHGAWVSCIAHMNHGQLAPGATPVPLDQVTPAMCGITPATAPTTDASGTGHGKSKHAHDKSGQHGHKH